MKFGVTFVKFVILSHFTTEITKWVKNKNVHPWGQVPPSRKAAVWNTTGLEMVMRAKRSAWWMRGHTLLSYGVRAPLIHRQRFSWASMRIPLPGCDAIAYKKLRIVASQMQLFNFWHLLISCRMQQMMRAPLSASHNEHDVSVRESFSIFWFTSTHGRENERVGALKKWKLHCSDELQSSADAPFIRSISKRRVKFTQSWAQGMEVDRYTIASSVYSCTIHAYTPTVTRS